MSVPGDKPIDVQKATGHAAVLVAAGKDRSTIVAEVVAMDVPQNRAEALVDDYINSVAMARSEVRKNNMRYAISWFFLTGMVAWISIYKGYGVEYSITIPMILGGVFMLRKMMKS